MSVPVSPCVSALRRKISTSECEEVSGSFRQSGPCWSLDAFLARTRRSTGLVLLLGRVAAQPLVPVLGDFVTVHPEVGVFAGICAQFLGAAMTGALAAGFTFGVRLSKAIRIVANGAVIAHVVVEWFLHNVSTTVMEAASYFVRTVPHHLGVVANHGRNVIPGVSE